MESASKDILLGALVELLNEKEFKKDLSGVIRVLIFIVK